MPALISAYAVGLLLALVGAWVVLRAELQSLRPKERLPLLRWTLLGLQAMLSSWFLAQVPILELFQDQRGNGELGRILVLVARSSSAGLIGYLPGAAATLFLAVRPLYGPGEDRRIVGPLLAAGLYGAAFLALALKREDFLG
jgi:hypothetical protein